LCVVFVYLFMDVCTVCHNLKKKKGAGYSF
jgi:hypothetical protein